MEGEKEQFEELDDDFLSSIAMPDDSCHIPEAPAPSRESSNDETLLRVKENISNIQIKQEIKTEPVLKMETPTKFQFPFEPYDIQVNFMRNLYTTLEAGKLGIFESPTGTGKSLSLICGALTWLQDYEEKQRRELEALLSIKQEVKSEPQIKSEPTEPDWIQEFAKKQKEDEATKKLKEEQVLRTKREARLEQLRGHLRPNKRRDKRKRDKLEDQFDELFKDASMDFKKKLEADISEQLANENGSVVEFDEEVVLEEYHSEDEGGKGDQGEESEEEEEEHITKIYYCSRTHSQLAQFVREVQKSPFGDNIRVVSLGSRQNLCINESVRRLQSQSLINDRCLDMQRHKSEPKRSKDGENPAKKKKGSGGCPYYKQELLTSFRDRALVEVQDIEQLVGAGRQIKACPYYGTRLAIPAAQLVVLPYQMLLHKATRESCGVKVKDNIVVIDEAHNLLETITNIHSVQVTGTQLTCAYSQLSQYQDRYRSRLKAKNLMYIRQILFILSAFIKILGGKVGAPADKQQLGKTDSRLQTINDFLFDSHLDNLNLFKVMKYCRRSNISRKLHGFVEKYQPQILTSKEKKTEAQHGPSWALSRFLSEISQSKDTNTQNTPNEAGDGKGGDEDSAVIPHSPLMNIEGFLEALTNADKDGRIVIHKQALLSASSIKFLLLNPSVHFTEIVREARAVVVAGGTMQPVEEFKDQLFRAAGSTDDRILEFSCGHVISPKQLLPIALARGSSGLELDFTYQSRDKPPMMSELGRVVYNVCNLIPGGIVCFFPSYELERTVYAHWEKEGFLSKMSSRKKVFREPKKASQVDSVLTEYTACIKRTRGRGSALTGAILFCVVGGKMSEGINFSDDLGRCVIMVGLPYPNIRSPELKEKMDYLNATQPKGPEGKLPGQVHYENLCMKAVNQSIGRAIRHKGDYATILLLDQRYQRPSVRSRLPGWIGEHLRSVDRFGPAVAMIKQFFADKQTCH